MVFFPEERPFFLEGIDLFSTPIQTHYTCTFTAPRWGARARQDFGRSFASFLYSGRESC